MVKLRYSFGSAHPLLANQLSEVLDPLDYWWGLNWSPLLDLDSMTQEQEQKLYVDFQKAQYSLLHVLSEKFGTLEKQSIADHDPVQLVESSRRSTPTLGSQSSSFFPTSQHSSMDSDALDDHVVAIRVHVPAFYCRQIRRLGSH